ncbi:LLM class flavin-dependent oxidoreductase [Actinomadura kijaniata]|uniref:Alkanesulfonate monooxygenase SsuD/methylene tetrahydromethanopterin reductase-like flavin-dependent oxidoreductase (Luciferase family) n=1 Tax=Actinomadura namibiensis TaxID=182080 RepID=A0A7W3QMC2_ACTNM|nr:LLM class flavin-dependent oxidoreductase [Actinomadura namibiensis]MBA8952422.1 alkanesulfonate monooxygenase SsuD/methylene tetrahydromethanopterin reductase-like flavin-dependent oxidoreductase (luciferase family) [Actinomadura namibiensis]
MTEPRTGTVIWPMQSWPEAGDLWRRAEELGFDTAWVYDHTAWRGATPWYDAYTTLAAAAATTSRIRLGTLVTSPNFRHPVPTAHAARTIDHISGGRLTLGIGSGGTSRTSDGGILGGPEWTPRERAERFTEWVDLLDRLLRGGETTVEGAHYSAREVNMGPGCVQRPRVPFLIAATGARGMRLAARQGAGWVTTANGPGAGDPFELVRVQGERLDEACAAEGRDPAGLRRVLLTGFTGEPWLESAQAFADLAGRYAGIGITDIAVHWPRPGTDWDADTKVFEAVAPAARR